MKCRFIAAILFTFGVTLTNLAAKPDSSNFALVTAPAGDFQLMRTSNGAIWLVPTKNPTDHVVLPAVQIEVNTEAASSMKRVSSDSVERQPECSVSPDERWIFVEVDTGGGNTTGILYQRTPASSGGSANLRYEPAYEKQIRPKAAAIRDNPTNMQPRRMQCSQPNRLARNRRNHQ